MWYIDTIKTSISESMGKILVKPERFNKTKYLNEIQIMMKYK